MPPVDAVLLIFAVLLGLVFGSFLNVCIWRLPRGESIVSPGSHCPACKHPIRPLDNIPIVSWLLLRGRCRDCGLRISLRYPLVEAGTAVLFAFCLLHFGVSARAAGTAVFCWLLLGLLLMDVDTFLLPDAFTLPGLAGGVVWSALTTANVRDGLMKACLGAALVAGFLWLVRLVYSLLQRGEGMGLGDVKLGAMLGAWLGWQMGCVALFLAIGAGALGGIVLAMTRQRSGADAREPAGRLKVPFGAFLAAGGIVTVFAGGPMLRWYLGFFPR